MEVNITCRCEMVGTVFESRLHPVALVRVVLRRQGTGRIWRVCSYRGGAEGVAGACSQSVAAEAAACINHLLFRLDLW